MRDTGKRVPAIRTRPPVRVRLDRPARTAFVVRVLLLHGLGSSGSAWNAYCQRAGAAYELWVAELPWRAEGGDAWARRDIPVTTWIREAMAAVPTGADVVMAHSFAASALLALLAGDSPAPPGTAPRALVLVSPFYRAREEDFDWPAIAYYLNDFDRILSDGIRVRAPGGLDPGIREDMALRVRDRIGPYGWMRFFDTYLRTPRLHTGRLTGPALVIGGTEDFASFPRDSRALAAALPDARLHLFTGCGHFAMTECADEFGTVVNEFVDLHTPQPAPAATDHDTAKHDTAKHDTLEHAR